MIERILAVSLREWNELRRSRIVISTMLVPSAIFVILPLVILGAGVGLTDRAGPLGDVGRISPEDLQVAQRVLPHMPELTPGEAFQVFLVNQFLVLFMLGPLFIPLTIASYSIIGEKQLRSLEPLLATPIRTWELLLAKIVGAAAPGVFVTWSSYAIFAVASRLILEEAVARFVVGPTWLAAFALLAPLFALLAVGLAVVASARTYDPRAAQQLGAVVILPVAGLLFAQLAGLVFLDLPLLLGIAAVAAIVDLGLLALAVRLFRRETILTRWK